jgi:dTMP kinase
MKRGIFVVFEGVDRCGKSTQCRLLSKYLSDRGYSVVDMRFPDRTTPIGTMINAYLTNNADMDDKAIHLLFSANRWEMRYGAYSSSLLALLHFYSLFIVLTGGNNLLVLTY